MIKMGGGLFGLGKGAPSRFPYKGRPQQVPGLGASSQGNVFKGRTVIVFGPSGSVVGVFVYQPGTTPALGNPPIASMTASTVDPFGNAVKPDISVYGTGGNTTFLSMVPGSPAVLNVGTGDAAEATPGQVNGRVIGSGGARFISTDLRAARVAGENASALAEIQLFSPSADLSLGPGLNLAATSLDGTNTSVMHQTSAAFAFSGAPITSASTSAAPTLITSDSWVPILAAAFSNGWTATAGGLCRYRLLPNGLVYVQADVTAGTLADGTNMFQLLPSVAIYNPVQITPLPAVVAAGAAALANSPYVNITTSRVVQAHNFPAGTTRVVISGFYPSGSQLP